MFLRPKHMRSKFDENNTKMVFVGYDVCIKGYRCVNTLNRKIVISRNVKFLQQLEKYGFKQSKFDPCVYLNDKLTLIIAAYVDNFLFFYK